MHAPLLSLLRVKEKMPKQIMARILFKIHCHSRLISPLNNKKRNKQKQKKPKNTNNLKQNTIKTKNIKIKTQQSVVSKFFDLFLIFSNVLFGFIFVCFYLFGFYINKYKNQLVASNSLFLKNKIKFRVKINDIT
ncbi:hypothetical protein BJ886_4467 [Enterobacter sp. WP_7_2]|nr:hypothetical protein BJ886_4467 [Enterobacter sp. WP_7_2]